MDISTQKAITKVMLVNKFKEEGKEIFSKVTHNNKSINVAYEVTTGFKSFMIIHENEKYVFINERLSEEERQKEIQTIIEDKEMHYLTNDDIKTMDDLLYKKSCDEMNYKSIRYGDFKTVSNNATYKEFVEMRKLVGAIHNIMDKENDIRWRIDKIFVYLFKLGEMQGKREERQKNKKKFHS